MFTVFQVRFYLVQIFFCTFSSILSPLVSFFFAFLVLLYPVLPQRHIYLVAIRFPVHVCI